MATPPRIFDAAYNEQISHIDYWDELSQSEQDFLMEFWKRDSGWSAKGIKPHAEGNQRKNERQRDVTYQPVDAPPQKRRADSYSYTEYMAASLNEDQVIALIDRKAQLLRDYPTEESIEARVRKDKARERSKADLARIKKANNPDYIKNKSSK